MYILTLELEKALSNIIKKHMTSFVSNYFNKLDRYPSQSNYQQLFETADSSFTRMSQDTITTLLESIDHTYRNSPNRREVAYVKDTRSRTIWTWFGTITFKRTIYQRRDNKSCFCYLDELLGLPKYIKFDPILRSMVCEAAANSNSLIKVGQQLGRRCLTNQASEAYVISRQSIRNIIRSTNIHHLPNRALKTPSTLYIMADEKYIAIQGNKGKKQMVKYAVVYENRDCSNSKRPVLQEKHHFVWTGQDFWTNFLDELNHKYDLHQVKNIYLMGDGASWIKSGEDILRLFKEQQVEFLLDHFHYKKALNTLPKDGDSLNKIDSALRHRTKPEVFQLLMSIDNNTLSRYQFGNWQYLIRHIDDIQRMFKYPEIMCSMEAKISHELASIFSSVPKAYSLPMLDKLLKLRMAYCNGLSIRALYFENTHHNTLNTSNEFNFSIFDYSHKKGYAIAHPNLASFISKPFQYKF